MFAQVRCCTTGFVLRESRDISKKRVQLKNFAALDPHSFHELDLLRFDGVDDIERFTVSTDRAMGGASYATFSVRAVRREGRADVVRGVFEGVILGPRIRGHDQTDVLRLGVGGNVEQVLLGEPQKDSGAQASASRDIRSNDPRRPSVARESPGQGGRLVLEYGEWRSGVGAGSLGWAMTRTKPADVFPRMPSMSGLLLTVRGDGRAYQVVCKGGQRQFGHVPGVEAEATYVCHLQPPAGRWVTVAAPFPSFLRVSRGHVWGEQRWEDVDRFDLGRGLNPNELSGLGFLLADGMDGPFSLEVRSVKAVRHIEGVTDEEEEALIRGGLLAARSSKKQPGKQGEGRGLPRVEAGG